MLLALTHALQDSNSIGDAGAGSIGEGLKVNSSLQKLYLVRLVFQFAFLFLFVISLLLLRERAGG